jgi:hypothetical protein
LQGEHSVYFRRAAGRMLFPRQANPGRRVWRPRR